MSSFNLKWSIDLFDCSLTLFFLPFNVKHGTFTQRNYIPLHIKNKQLTGTSVLFLKIEMMMINKGGFFQIVIF